MTSNPINLRPPTATALPQPQSHSHPTIEWLARTWHVTHSTLPMWSSKRNVTITYKPLQSKSSQLLLDDIVSYQTRSSDKVKTVNGIDTASGHDAGTWDWRGRGWLKIASSHWEVLGWGELDGGERWVVTYFAKTLFTPAGIDVYSSAKEGSPGAVLENIKDSLSRIEDAAVKKLAGEIFEVERD